jgi:hypothetical protein
MTTQESSQWSYYQSKSIKLHIIEMESDLLSVESLKSDVPAVKDKIQVKIKALEDSLGRYNKEKDAIKAKAESLADQQSALKRHGGNFGLSVMFFQIAIMLAAIGSLLKQRTAWLFGLAIGVAGLVYFINGFFLIF